MLYWIIALQFLIILGLYFIEMHSVKTQCLLLEILKMDGFRISELESRIEGLECNEN